MSEQSERRKRAGEEQRLRMIEGWFATLRLQRDAINVDAVASPAHRLDLLQERLRIGGLLMLGNLLCHLHGVDVPSAADASAPPTVPVRVMEGE